MFTSKEGKQFGAQMYGHSKHNISLAPKQCKQISHSDPKTILMSLLGVHCLQIYILY